MTVLLLAGIIGIFTVGSSGSTARTRAIGPATTAPSTSAASPITQPATIEAFIPEAERFVEQHRGLKFTAPVQVTLLDDEAFKKRLLADEDTDKAEIDKATKVLRALGLIQGNPDIAKAEDALLGEAVAGFYDPKTKALVVRGVAPTPYVRGVLVHELTHAVQDQHFGINRPELDKSDDERGDAFSAVVEGDAVRIENEYRQSLSAAEQKQADTEENSQAAGIDPSAIPQVLIELLVFPYEFGPSFTQAVVAARGQAGLDDAFAHPPTTSEQIIHPEKFLAGEGARAVDAPTADGPVIDKGVIGEYGLDLMLERAVTGGGLTADDLRQASAGWGGDAYVAWDAAGQTCVRVAMVMDTPTDTSQVLNALRKYAATRRGVTISGSGPVTVTSCG
jgi:hypothetical protein